MRPIEAELAKLFCNAWRYINFAIANQFYVMARHFEADFHAIYHALREDYPRMQSLARPGFAAGPCLLKDTMQLGAFNHGSFVLGQAAMMINEGLPYLIVQDVKRAYPLADMTVGILGMAFKPNSDDPRSSLSYKLRKVLLLECKQRPLHRPLRARREPDAVGGSAGPGRLAHRRHAARLLQGADLPPAGDRHYGYDSPGGRGTGAYGPDTAGRGWEVTPHENPRHRRRRLHRRLPRRRTAATPAMKSSASTTSPSTAPSARPSLQHAAYRFVQGDAKDVGLLGELMRDVDQVVAGAARIGGISYFHEFAYDLLAENERLTAAVFDAAIAAHKRGTLKKINVISSSMVFENADGLADAGGRAAPLPAAALHLRLSEAGDRILRPGGVGTVSVAVHDLSAVQLRRRRRTAGACARRRC